MKGISVGIKDFKEAIETSYYIDKSQFIAHAISDKVSFITRPRRFGKTLNMSMLKYFFDINEKDNAYLFNDLKITKNKEIMKHQNKYPVISLTLKEVKGKTFKKAMSAYASELLDYVSKHKYLLNGDGPTPYDRELLEKYLAHDASDDELESSLKALSRMLYRYHNQLVIILVDEYDVPLQSAYRNGYYDEMVRFLQTLLGSALKSNDYLFKGVLTGCLRIARESIFTGLNNFSVYSIFDETTAEDFDFTQSEVNQMLRYYHLEDRKDAVKDWYDGYRFGDSDVYNPWSTLKYVKSQLGSKAKKEPESFWANSSGNDIVYDYIKNGNDQLKEEFNILVKGESINKEIKEELTYREMDDINNIYSFLLFTGYLKPVRKTGYNEYNLMIPNKEVKTIYNSQFDEWFKNLKNEWRPSFSQALINENVTDAEDILNYILGNVLSYHDTKEKFYHGLLSGMLSNIAGMTVKSNRESGDGRFDLFLLSQPLKRKAIIIECKITQNKDDLDRAAHAALDQIEEKHYDRDLVNQRYSPVIKYGIAFYKKECKILMK